MDDRKAALRKKIAAMKQRRAGQMSPTSYRSSKVQDTLLSLAGNDPTLLKTVCAGLQGKSMASPVPQVESDDEEEAPPPARSVVLRVDQEPRGTADLDSASYVKK